VRGASAAAAAGASRAPVGRRGPLRGAVAAAAAAAVASLAAAQPAAAVVGFNPSTLHDVSVTRPTALQFGPDGRLYVTQQNGVIKAFNVARLGPSSYAATATETISLVHQMPNRNDDGQLNGAVKGRLVTGLAVTGSAGQPVIYVVSSDPRIGGGKPGEGEAEKDLDLDTNSGVLSKLTKGPGGWTKQDLVRGLPRSEENHTGNGLALKGQTLYIAQGGNTNNGAPSVNFALLPEVALSAAILAVDLWKIPAGGYDLPTLDDPARGVPGAADPGDPFGGNDGHNQAVLEAAGPVRVHAPGFRNAYDVIAAADGSLYTVDNGGNAGWGHVPKGEGPGGACTNDPSEPGTTNNDQLFDVTAPGTYGGHPNPTRANKLNTFHGQSPILGPANPKECDYLTAAEAGALAQFPESTNGITEYTAAKNFGGEAKGDLFTLDVTGGLWHVPLDAAWAGMLDATKQASSYKPLMELGPYPLDIVAQGDADQFPGTLWYTNVGGAIGVLEPHDYGGGPGVGACHPSSLPDAGDTDGDGYQNGDEKLAGSNPCLPGSVPKDADADHVSDRKDADDDNDGRNDPVDPFARDASNGLTLTGSVDYAWENDEGVAGTVWNLGFTGLMTNGVDDYLDQFPQQGGMTIGGAAGVFTLDEMDPGDALLNNKQRNAFQFGINARPQHGAFTVRTSLVAPFQGLTPANFQSMGMYVGSGDQDNYVKVVAGANAGTGVQALREATGQPVVQHRTGLALPGPDHVDLYLRVDPVASTVQASFTTTAGGSTSAPTLVGKPIPVPPGWFTAPTGLAVGLISTSTGSTGTPPSASWDFVTVTREKPGAAPPVTTPRPATLPPKPGAKPTGTSGKGPARPARDRVRPTLRGVTLSRTSFRASGRRSGTAVRFRLSEAASVRLTVARLTTGRRVGGTCRKATRATRSAPRCRRYVTVGRLAKPMPAGAGRMTFSGRLAGRRLPAGRYRMTVVATDAAGNRSKAVHALFRIVR